MQPTQDDFFFSFCSKRRWKIRLWFEFQPSKAEFKDCNKKKTHTEQIHVTAIVSFQFLKEISADLATLTPGRSLSEQIICDHESTFNHDSECGDISKTTKKKETSKLLHLILEEGVVLPSHQAKGKQSTCLIKGLVVTGVRERHNMRS